MKKVHFAIPVHPGQSVEWYEWICNRNSVEYGDIEKLEEIDPRSSQDSAKVTCMHCLRRLPRFIKDRINGSV